MKDWLKCQRGPLDKYRQNQNKTKDIDGFETGLEQLDLTDDTDDMTIYTDTSGPVGLIYFHSSLSLEQPITYQTIL